MGRLVVTRMNGPSVLFHTNGSGSMRRTLRLFAAGCALFVVPAIAHAQEGAREAPPYDFKALDGP
jgi:hypothetical protein